MKKQHKPTLQVVTMPRVGRPRKTNGEVKEGPFAVKPCPVPQNPTRLDGVRLKIFLDRYAWKDERGKPIEEVPEQMWARVAKAIAQVEKNRHLRNFWEDKFYYALSDFKFLPGGRILSAAGTGYEVTYYNCFVIPSPEDSRGGIIDNLKVMMEIMSRAGGVGINLSSLRPRGARVHKVNGTSSGPVSWANLYSTGTHDVIQQGGCFGEETSIMTHLGLVPISEIVKTNKDWYAATHQGYQRITNKFNNGIKKLYQVKTAAGYSVKVTPEHKMLTVDRNGHFYLQELKDFKVGDSLTMLLGDWREDIPYAPLNTFIPAPSKFSYGRRRISLPKILNEKLAFLLGVYDADGSKVRDEFSPNGKGFRIAVAANRPKDLEKIVATIKDVFGLEPVVKPGDGAVLNVTIYSREVMEFLNLNGLLKKYSINVEVPQLFFSSPKSVVQAYIAGVFTGDGGNRGGKGGFRLSTVSQKYASDLQLLLLNLGIAAKINITNRLKLGWRNLYSVTINGHKFMKRFHQIVSDFCEKANDYAISKKDDTFNWPFNLTEKFLYLSGFQRTIARTNVHTSQKAVQFLSDRLPQINEIERDDVAILVNAIPDKITSIEYLGEKQVYDLEVENSHLLSGNGFYTSNSRRGALMLMLNDWHPDVEEFIEVKQDLSKINGANLSVCASDSFMEAVEKDQDWNLRFPDTKHPKYDSEWDGDILEWEAKGYPVKVYKTVKAREIWDKICQAAWRSAEPGLVFMERYNKWSNTWYFEKIICVNPCGEQGLGAWSVCNLGALNLAAFVEDNLMNYEKLAEISAIATRFLDNVVDANYYFYPENERQQKAIRRTGLGTMGLGDALIKMKLRYGPESLETIEKIYRTIRDAAYEASADIAKEKSSFPNFNNKKYLQGYFIKQLPERIRQKIANQGMRNAVVLTQAPTGTTSLLAGVSSGIEPVYDFAFVRRDRTGESVLYHPIFKEWKDANPESIVRPSYFVAANDLTPDDHVLVQAMVQKYTDSSISKTVNAPNSHTVEQVQKLYMDAYKLGCKGITYMRDGSRDGVLSHIGDKKAEQGKLADSAAPVAERPMILRGRTYKITTPVGEAFITVNRDEQDQPFEVFVTVGRGGMHTMADAEAMGRLVSLSLRLARGAKQTDPKAVALKIVGQLKGIGGASHVGFGKNRVMSLADAIAKVLAEDLAVSKISQASEQVPLSLTNGENSPISDIRVPTSVSADLCPECGSASFVMEEGCQKCHSCGYSMC